VTSPASFKVLEALKAAACRYLGLGALRPEDPYHELALAGTAKKGAPDLLLEAHASSKVGFETALAFSYAGKRAAVITSAQGAYQAADPILSAAYTGIKGGFVLITFHQSGDEDARALGFFAKLPVLAYTRMNGLNTFLGRAFSLSESFSIPVLVEIPARSPFSLDAENGPSLRLGKSQFERNPNRWAATPKFRFQLHKELNRKLKDLEDHFLQDEAAQAAGFLKGKKPLAVLAAGPLYQRVRPLLKGKNQAVLIPLEKIHPFPRAWANRLMENFAKILILEEPLPVLEWQWPDSPRILGRRRGPLPARGLISEGEIQKALSLLKGTASLGRLPGSRSANHKIASSHLSRLLNQVARRFPESKILSREAQPWHVLPDTASLINLACGMVRGTGKRVRETLVVLAEGPGFPTLGLPALVNALYNGGAFLLLLVYPAAQSVDIRLFELLGIPFFRQVRAKEEVAGFKTLAEGMNFVKTTHKPGVIALTLK
jgi:indolepyruvate ferredoxin oxidoreductase alpha subunit